MRACLAIALVLVVAIIAHKNARNLSYGTKADVIVKPESVAQLLTYFPSNPNLMMKRNHAEYDYHTRPQNSLCTRRPYIVFAPANEDQVRAVLLLLKREKQSFAIFKAGLDCSGTSKSVVISLRKLTRIILDSDNGLLKVEAGVRLSDINRHIEDYH